jgi:hypothetical protein
MSYVDSFMVTNIFPAGVNVTVKGIKEGSTDTPLPIDNGPVQFMCTSIILWVEKNDGTLYGDFKIEFPDLIMEFPVKSPPSPKNTSLTVENKNKKIVIRLKNFKLPGRTGSPTSVNVQVGGN